MAGLGDVVERITEATGIKAAVEIFSEATGIDCGCEDRKKLLNKLFPISRAPKCMTADQFESWKKYRESRSEIIGKDQQKLIATLHADLFNHAYHEPCTCSPKRWIQMVKDLDRLFDTYGQQ